MSEISVVLFPDGWVHVLWDQYVLRHNTEQGGSSAPCYRWDQTQNLLTVVTNLDHPFVRAWPAGERGCLYTNHLAEAVILAFGTERKDPDSFVALKSVLLAELVVRFGLREPAPPPAPSKPQSKPRPERGRRRTNRPDTLF